MSIALALGALAYAVGVVRVWRSAGAGHGVLRWQARLYAYLAGLVDAYPPFALDTGPETSTMPQQAPPEPTA